MNCPNFIAWLPSFPVILSNMGIVIVRFLGCEVISFDIKLIFLVKPFFPYDQKFKPKI